MTTSPSEPIEGASAVSSTAQAISLAKPESAPLVPFSSTDQPVSISMPELKAAGRSSSHQNQASAVTAPVELPPGSDVLSDRESKGSARSNTRPTPDPASFTELRIWAECFEDAQRARISCTNRMERGGVPPALFEAHLATLLRAEKEIGLVMRRSYRRVVPASIVAWQKETRGIGEHLLARFLGVNGHPVLATPYHWEGEGDKRELIADPPFLRTVSQFWARCGHGDPTRKRKKGMSAEAAAALGNPRLKMLVHLLAESTKKQKANPGPHRLIYEKARVDYAEREGWTAGHQDAAALRKVGKEILRDLWKAAS